MNPIFDREQIYLLLPSLLQNAAVSLEGRRLIKRRYDFDFQKVFEEYNRRTFMPTREAGLFREIRLRRFLSEAGQAPYWKEKFRKHGVDIAGADIFAELDKLPILTKGEVKASHERFVNKNAREETVACHTSGTTGSGLIFSVTRSAEREQWATWWRYRQWHGIGRDTWCGYFGGRSIVPLGRRRPPYWRINRPGRQIIFSAYHLGSSTARAYIKALAERSITWLHGYPSTLALLASFVRDLNIKPLPTVKVVTTGAESLLPHQRRLIQEVFAAEVFQHYGQAEGVANLSECEGGRLHVDEDFSLVEFIQISGTPRKYRIIGTNWTNPVFPLIRYDTGDIATLSVDECTCGRPGRLVQAIDGRKEDYLVLPDGVKVGRLDHIFKDLVHVREAQIIQGERGQVVFRVVKDSEYDRSGEENKLFMEARKRLGHDMDIRIEYTDNIPRTAAGKLRFVISHITSGKLESPYQGRANCG